MKRFCIVLLSFLLSMLQLEAQNTLYKNLFLEEGNVSVKVNSLAKIPQSYIYLGTDKGLYQFNGSKFNLISSENKSPISALSVFNKTLWIAYQNGKIAFLQEGKIKPFALPKGLENVSIKSLSVQGKEDIWIGTDEGLFHFKYKKLSHFNTNDGLSDNYVYKIILDGDNNVWTASDQGINYLQKKGETYAIQHYSTQLELNDEIVSEMAVLSDKHVILGSERGTLALLDLSSKQLMSLPLSKPIEGQIQSILKVDDNNIIVSTTLSNIYSINLSPNSISIIEKLATEKLMARDLLQDQSGNIWVATDNGLSMLSYNYLNAIPLSIPYKLSHLSAISVDAENQCWLALDKILYRLDEQQQLKKVQHFSSKISAIHIDINDNIWIGTAANGVWKRNANGVFTAFKPLSAIGLGNDGILSISSNKEQIWFAGLSGLTAFGLKDHQQIIYPKNIADHYIYNLISDSQQNLWMASDGAGISRITGNNESNWDKLGDKNEAVIYSMASDGKHMWAGSMGNNIYQFTNSKWSLFAASRPNHLITGLQVNASGQLIASFQNCVDQWYPQSNAFRHFNIRQHLGIDSFSSTLNINAIDKKGNIYIPYDKGILVFKSQDQQVFDIKPNILMAQVFVNNELFNEGQNQLDADEYLFKFLFDGISFTNPERLQYRYKLEGYNNEWLYTKDVEAVFPKLKWGNYTFKVQVSLSDNFDKAEEAVFQFTIARPLLYRPWFIVLMVLSLLGIIILIIKLREQRMKKMADLKEDRMRFEFEHLKSQVNPHFLFNSLNTLTGLIEDNQENAILYTERLSDLYRHSLQSYQKDKALVAEEVALLKSYIYIQEARFGTAIQVAIEVPEAIQEQNGLPTMALQLVVENAMKHNVVAQSQPLHISIFVDEHKNIVVKNKINLKKSKESFGGLGLKNLDRRYKMLSGKNIEYGEKDGYWQVKLPLLEL